MARQLAPMISKFIRAQWESKEMVNADDERRQLLEEAMELDHIWGCLGGGERADQRASKVDQATISKWK